MSATEKTQSQGDYAVGYGKPPVESRFQKGQSGNPSGRPRFKERERAKALALSEAYRLVTVRDGDQMKRIPAIQAVHRSQIALAAKGNGPAQRAVLRIVQAIEGERHSLDMELVKTAIEYKADAEREIARRARLGITDISDIDPHPDQVLIDMQSGRVVFLHRDFAPLRCRTRKKRAK
jgi:hypothetical protein